MSEQDAIVETPDEPTEEEVLASIGEPEEESHEEDAIEEEFEEAEIEEKEGVKRKVKVSKGYKDWLMREDDYRRKTHQTGEEKRRIEAERAALAEERRLTSELDDERAELKALNKKLAEYDKVTPEQWLAWREQDEKAVADAQFARDMLKQQRDKLQDAMKEKVQTLTAKEKEKISAWEAEQTKAIKERVPDWSNDKAKAVAEHVGAKFGIKISPTDLKDAGVVALVNHVYDQDKKIEAARAKAREARREQEPEPVVVGKVNGGKTGAPRGPNRDTLKHNPAAFDAAISKMLYGGP